MISYHPSRPDVSQPQAYTRGFKEAIIIDLNRIARGITQYVWSPILFKEGHRIQSNFLSCMWCALDFDTPFLALADACKIFCDTTHIIGTTKSHQKEKGGIICDRYRVVLRFSQPITDLRTYRYNMKLMHQKYDDADRACLDGARFFYPCSEIISIVTGDYLIDVVTSVPDEFERFDTKPNAYTGTGLIPPWARMQLKSVVPVGERNTTFYRVAKDLAKSGFSYEDIWRVIVNSPTYKDDPMEGNVMEKLRECTRNGYNAASTLQENHKSGKGIIL